MNQNDSDIGHFTQQQQLIKCLTDLSKKTESWTTYRICMVVSSFTLPIAVFALGVWWDWSNKRSEKRQENVKQKDELLIRVRDIYFKLKRRPMSVVREEAETQQEKLFQRQLCARCVLFYDLKEYMQLKLRNSDLKDDTFKPYQCIFDSAFIRDLYDDMNTVTEMLILISKVFIEFDDKSGEIKQGLKDIGMSYFVEELYDIWVTYYYNLYYRGTKPDNTDHIHGLRRKTPCEQGYYKFICERISKLLYYLSINAQFELIATDGSGITHTEHTLNPQQNFNQGSAPQLSVSSQDQQNLQPRTEEGDPLLSELEESRNL